eukprot:m.342321 g.342321  ORF g.342321 m.342321 type:complete len:349 (+) comp21235_c0_seq1:131-1177(+)
MEGQQLPSSYAQLARKYKVLCESHMKLQRDYAYSQAIIEDFRKREQSYNRRKEYDADLQRERREEALLSSSRALLEDSNANSDRETLLAKKVLELEAQLAKVKDAENQSPNIPYSRSNVNKKHPQQGWCHPHDSAIPEQRLSTNSVLTKSTNVNNTSNTGYKTSWKEEPNSQSYEQHIGMGYGTQKTRPKSPNQCQRSFQDSSGIDARDNNSTISCQETRSSELLIDIAERRQKLMDSKRILISLTYDVNGLSAALAGNKILHRDLHNNESYGHTNSQAQRNRQAFIKERSRAQIAEKLQRLLDLRATYDTDISCLRFLESKASCTPLSERILQLPKLRYETDRRYMR